MQIAITGCGWVTPKIAGRIEDVLHAYSRSSQTVDSVTNYEPILQSIFDQYPNLPAEAAKEAPVRIAAIALEIACAQASLTTESHRKGLVVGCALAGVGGMIDFANDVREQSPRFVSPIRFPQTVGNYICGALARSYDFRGPASTIACGSASSLEAIREACAMLVSNQVDAVIAGGCETLSPEIVEGMTEPGVGYADGACFFVLEREGDAAARGARILARLSPAFATPNTTASSSASNFAAGYRESGAVCIEEWTGRTLGADGAGAVAAAIGCISGLEVPRTKAAVCAMPVTAVTVRAKGMGVQMHTQIVSV